MREQLAGSGTSDYRLVRSADVITALAVGIISLCLIFFREIQAAIEVWNASTAYSHCYLVLPMAMYLLWERRDVIRRSQAEPDLRLALLAVPLTVSWLITERLGIMEARQLVVVTGVELLCLTVLGRRFFLSVSGPLLFLYFLVPFGAFLTPALQQFTATFSILGLDLLGIPNFSDKFTIETPAGVFFVAEACAGLRFLIASIAFGVFYSVLIYISIYRRFMFIAASVVVPVIANGFRALGIVVLGQVLGSAEAAAADHLIYGWIFFSIVMLLLIAGGHVFREPGRALVHRNAPVSAVPPRSLVWCIISVVVLLSLGPALAAMINSTLVLPTLPDTAIIVAPVGCSSGNRPGSEPASRRSFTLVCGGERFEVNVEAFASRSTSGAMISELRRITQEAGAENSAASVVDLPAGAGYWTLMQTTDPNRVTAYAGWVDGIPVVSSLAGRIAQARNSLFGTAHAPALITITVAEPANKEAGQRRATLERLTALLREQLNLSSRMETLTRLGV